MSGGLIILQVRNPACAAFLSPMHKKESTLVSSLPFGRLRTRRYKGTISIYAESIECSMSLRPVLSQMHRKDKHTFQYCKHFGYFFVCASGNFHIPRCWLPQGKVNHLLEKAQKVLLENSGGSPVAPITVGLAVIYAHTIQVHVYESLPVSHLDADIEVRGCHQRPVSRLCH